MTDPASDDPGAPADRTRDIALPPLPDRPPPKLPEAWAGLRPAATPVDAPTTAVPGAPAPPAQADQQVTEEDTAAAEARRLAGMRTDEHAPPPGTARDRTLAFTAPEMRHRPIEPVRVGSTPRRWPWVVLALVPVLIIVVSAIAWLLMLDWG